MKVILCYLLLFLLWNDKVFSQQEIVINDNIDLRGKIEKVDIVDRGNGCIDIQLRYIGDCADRLDLYIDNVFYKSEYIPGGSKINESYTFSITALKGCEEIEVFVHFIDCKEPEPIVQDTVYIPTPVETNPCEPCLADCDTSGIYAFYDQFHNGWFKATTLPLNEVRSGFGWNKTWIKSVFVLSTDIQVGILDYKWIEDFDVNQYYYGAFYSGLVVNSGFDFGLFKVNGGLDISLSYDYENSEIDYTYYRYRALIDIWKLFISGEQEKYDLVQLYRIRSSSGYYNRAKLRIGYQDNLSSQFSFAFGYQTSISKYDDELYSRKHKPKWIGGFVSFNFCSFPFDLSTDISYESGDEIEFYKIDQILVDPPIDIFDVSLTVKYFLF
jgi:hypothetical protein